MAGTDAVPKLRPVDDPELHYDQTRVPFLLLPDPPQAISLYTDEHFCHLFQHLLNQQQVFFSEYDWAKSPTYTEEFLSANFNIQHAFMLPVRQNNLFIQAYLLFQARKMQMDDMLITSYEERHLHIHVINCGPLLCKLWMDDMHVHRVRKVTYVY